MNPAPASASNIQSALGWIYSLYFAIFTFLFFIIVVVRERNFTIALFAGITAFILARIAASIAGRFKRSLYGFLTCAIASIMLALIPVALIIANSASYFLGFAPLTTETKFLNLGLVYFLIAIGSAAPLALAATLIFHLILFVMRKQHWLAFEQRWL